MRNEGEGSSGVPLKSDNEADQVLNKIHILNGFPILHMGKLGKRIFSESQEMKENENRILHMRGT